MTVLKTSSLKKRDEDEEPEVVEPVSEERKFAKEVEDTVKRGLLDNHSVDNIALEIQALKFAYDQTFLDCTNAALISLLKAIAESRGDTPQSLIAAINTTIKKWGPLLNKFLTTTEDQVESIYTLEEYCGKEGEGYEIFNKYFQFVLHSLYENDVIEEDAILEWADSLEKEEDEDDKYFLKQCEKLLKWLREAEEDEDEDDEDEDEEDD